MSDPETTTSNDLGFQREDFTPPPVDPDRLYADHDRLLEQFNHLDPKSLVFGRPDLAQRYREEAELNFRALCIRAGVAPRVAPTPETRAAEQHAAYWKMAEMPDDLIEDLDARVEAAEQVPPSHREAAIAAIKYNLGEERYHHLANTLAHPTMDRRTFIATEGERQYQELVRLAKAALKPGETLNNAVLHDAYTLKTLAAYGKMMLAEERARPR